jgi:hypothetical protein
VSIEYFTYLLFPLGSLYEESHSQPLLRINRVHSTHTRTHTDAGARYQLAMLLTMI